MGSGSAADAPLLKDVRVPKLTTLPGTSHGDSQAAAQHSPGLFKWMLAQRGAATSADGAAANSSQTQGTAPIETDPRLHSNGNGWKLNQATVLDKARPRVLLIGDSILAGYQKFVIESVKDKAYIDAWVQPYHQGHMHGPLPKAIEEVLAKGPYHVILFNMGLHGFQKGRIPEGEFIPLTKKLVATLRQHAPGARLVWLSSTPVSAPDTRPEFRKLGPPPTPYALNAEINPTIVEHNRMAAEVMKEENVPVLDLYSLLAPQLNLAVGDMFHWTDPASKLMAAEITKVIIDNLPLTVAPDADLKP